jgi:hypothetical protein
LPFQGPPEFTQIGIFGMQIDHLATLAETSLKNNSITENVNSVYLCKSGTNVGVFNIFAKKIGEQIGYFHSKCNYVGRKNGS